MSTKAQFETARDSNLGDTAPASPSTPLRDPVCDRTIFDLIKNEFFSPIVEETETTTAVLTKIKTGISYKINVKKLGNIVFIRGYIYNGTGSTISPQTLIDITNSEYFPKSYSSESVYLFQGRFNIASGSALVQLTIATKHISCQSSINNGDAVIFEGHYYVND